MLYVFTSFFASIRFRRAFQARFSMWFWCKIHLAFQSFTDGEEAEGGGMGQELEERAEKIRNKNNIPERRQ